MESVTKIKGFTFFASYWEAIKKLNKKDRNDMLNAIMEYVFEDKKTQFSSKNELIWTLIQPTLDKSKNRSNVNSGAPKGNQNARKYAISSEIEEEKQKQSKNNQNSIKKQRMTSLSLSYSLSLSNSFINNYIINNNNNIKELFINYLIYRENNNLNIDEVVISELLNKLNNADSDTDREIMIKQATVHGWKDFYPIKKDETKSRQLKQVSEGAYKI